MVNPLNTKLDAVFRRIIKYRDKHTCQSCRKRFGEQWLDCAHFKSRAKKSTRWDPENCITLCRGCHSQLHHYPEGMAALMLRRLGPDAYDDLILRANKSLKLTKSDKHELLMQLETQLSEMLDVTKGSD